jgi:hypothetical protein
VSNPVVEILGLLGDVVLIPNYPMTKKPAIKNWQKATRELMKDGDYLQSFNGKNIGVLLGAASGGLCTIDLDNDSDVEPLLAKNPRLRETTRTKRVRGCNFWMYLDGNFPRSTTLQITEKGVARHFGEWRADGNQTLIHGRVIDKGKGETEPTEYKFLSKVSPIHMRFDEIVFPEHVSFREREEQRTNTIRLSTGSCGTASLNDCVPTSLHNTPEIILRSILARKEALKALAAEHPNLARLYPTIVEARFQAQAGARNDFVVNAVTFLYRAVAKRCVLVLTGCFYDCNHLLFKDSREKHLKEANSMLESVAKSYIESLNAAERRIYDALPEHEQDAFRICRDFASLPEPKRQPLTFFISFNHLADRLGLYPTQAQRIMRQFQGYGLVKSLKKGTRRAVGVKGEAGTWQWLLNRTTDSCGQVATTCSPRRKKRTWHGGSLERRPCVGESMPAGERCDIPAAIRDSE